MRRPGKARGAFRYCELGPLKLSLGGEFLRLRGLGKRCWDGRRSLNHTTMKSTGKSSKTSSKTPRTAFRAKQIELVPTDPRVFDLAGAIEKLPSFSSDGGQPQTTKATGTDDRAVSAGRSESVSSQQAGIGNCPAVIGEKGALGESSLTLVSGGIRRQKTPSGRDGENKRVKGVEPSTFTLAT
jgi:hypothetical protein